MRIVDVNEFYSPTGGGVRTYVDRKMAIMADLGHELICIAPGREDHVEERPGGGRIIYIKAPGLPFDRNYGLFWDAEPVTRLLDQLDPDVVECCSPWRPAWIVAGWRGRALKSFFMHNDNVETYAKRWFANVAPADRIERAFAWYSRYMERFLLQFHTVVANSPWTYQQMRARGVRVDAEITLGIERDHFSPGLRDDKLREALLAQCGLPASAHLLLGVGRHHPEKRWTMIIDAVERAGARMPVGLVLIGHGMQTRRIERRAANSPHIRLFRPVYDRKRLARIMASGDAFVHGCATETFGLVVSEALASGSPLVVPSEGGCAVVAGPDYAETYRPRDAVACAEAIERLFTRDQVALRAAAAQAATTVRTAAEHTAALLDHYQACIEARTDDRNAIAA